MLLTALSIPLDVIAALHETNGVQVAAAQLIGISERSLWYRLKKLEIHVDKIVR
ncbi:helix-turn-helix domain-containing protein [Pseudomonas sp. UBA5706]|uniref:helix-turn-helix domain-containing protein n=1 Tax=Pseudomonas sp. UBA5706 TaxID=1947321 RepID=UPI0039C9ADAB